MAWYVRLILSLELLPSQWQDTIQLKQLMILSFQYSELAHWKQSQMIANLLNRVRSENKTKRFRSAIGLSMDMKYEYEARYIWSILGKLR